MSLLSQKIRLTPTERKLTFRALKILGTFTAIMALTGLGAMLYTQRHQPMVGFGPGLGVVHSL